MKRPRHPAAGVFFPCDSRGMPSGRVGFMRRAFVLACCVHVGGCFDPSEAGATEGDTEPTGGSAATVAMTNPATQGDDGAEAPDDGAVTSATGESTDSGSGPPPDP